MRLRRCIRYLCDHCDRGFWSKKECLEHEPDCWFNPVRQPKERELYPWPKRASGNTWQRSTETELDRLEATHWPRAKWHGEGDWDYVTSSTDASPGWEPEHVDEPHLYLDGKWLILANWDCWEFLALHRDFRENSPLILSVDFEDEGLGHPSTWFVGFAVHYPLRDAHGGAYADDADGIPF